MQPCTSSLHVQLFSIQQNILHNRIILYKTPFENDSHMLSSHTIHQKCNCSTNFIACVSVPVWFRSIKRPWKGIFGFDRARNETRTPRSLTLVPCSLLLNRAETLATQATNFTEVTFLDMILDGTVITSCNIQG